MKTVTFYGTVHGESWGMGTAQREESCRVDRRARKGVKLRTLLVSKLSADFQSAKFTSDSVFIFASTKVKGRRTITQDVTRPITDFPSLRDLVCDEVSLHAS